MALSIVQSRLQTVIVKQSFFIVRLKFQKRSALKFVSRTIPLKAEGNETQASERNALKLAGRIILHKQGDNTPPLGAELGSRACPGVHTRD